MEQKSESFERFCSFDAMYDASYRVCRNVRWKDSTINLEESRIETILKTEADLRRNEYFQLVFSCFSIVERGKPRDIRACHINDRLVQSALCEEVLLPVLTPKFIYDNCATLKGRGIDFALKRFKSHLQAAKRTYGSDFACLRIDIRKYFDSIDHKALKEIARRAIKEDDIYKLVSYLIDTFNFAVTKDKTPQPGKQYYIVKGRKYVRVRDFSRGFEPGGRKYYEYNEKSLGLGSQTSQLLALLTLNDVDHFIKERLHIKFYGRYMDDLYLFYDDTKYLSYCEQEIEKELNHLGLLLNKDKTTILRVHAIQSGEPKSPPIKYLKWNFHITESGHILMIPFTHKLTQERRRLRKMHDKLLAGTISIHDIQVHYQGWRAHIKKGTTHYIIQDMDNYFSHLFKGVEIL